MTFARGRADGMGPGNSCRGSKPLDQVHVDYFDLSGRKFFLLVDAFTQWIEVHVVKQTDDLSLKKALNQVFRTFGDPVTLVCDNGPPFSSSEFADYCKLRSIRLLHSPPYHPESNGLAERAVRTVKEQMRKISVELGDVPIGVKKFTNRER